MNDQIVGQLQATELLLAQLTVQALLPVKDKNGLAADWRQEFVDRKDRMTPEAYRSGLDFLDRVFASSVNTANMLAEEIQKRGLA